MSEVENDYQKQKSTYFYKKHELRYNLDRDKKVNLLMKEIRATVNVSSS